jgi:RNA polymerase sigma-70 factor (ECF subfamily)
MLTDAAIREQIPRLRRYARALTGSRDAADDLVQDTLERALSRSALFRPGGSPRPWLFAIMHNVFVNQVRSAHARRTVALDVERMDPGMEDGFEERLSVRDLDRALATLPAEQREVMLLIALEALSYADTAKVVGVPVGTVMSRLSRGRERLRSLLEGSVEPPALKAIK